MTENPDIDHGVEVVSAGRVAVEWDSSDDPFTVLLTSESVELDPPVRLETSLPPPAVAELIAALSEVRDAQHEQMGYAVPEAGTDEAVDPAAEVDGPGVFRRVGRMFSDPIGAKEAVRESETTPAWSGKALLLILIASVLVLIILRIVG